MTTTRTAAELDELSDRALTTEELASLPRAPRMKIIRRALGLSQEEFAERYRIPLDILCDWEQGRCEPDAPARAFLEVIAREPKTTARALRRRPDAA